MTEGHKGGLVGPVFPTCLTLGFEYHLLLIALVGEPCRVLLKRAQVRRYHSQPTGLNVRDALVWGGSI